MNAQLLARTGFAAEAAARRATGGGSRDIHAAPLVAGCCMRCGHMPALLHARCLRKCGHSLLHRSTRSETPLA